MKVFKLFIGPSVAVTRRRAGVKQKERDPVRSAGDWRPRGRRSRSDGGRVAAPTPTGPCPPLTDSLDDPAIRLRRTSYSPSGRKFSHPGGGGQFAHPALGRGSAGAGHHRWRGGEGRWPRRSARRSVGTIGRQGGGNGGFGAGLGHWSGRGRGRGTRSPVG